MKKPLLYFTSLIFSVIISQGLLAQSLNVVFEFSKVKQVSPDTRDLAVAFHSIVFIDDKVAPIDTLLFGTDEANAIQGTGWHENEYWDNHGEFQWAGGSAMKAEITLDVPAGTEGMLVNINAVEDSLWMTVRIDDTIASQFRVDSYWRSSYIPIADASPVARPDSLPVWSPDMYFPDFPKTDHVYVLRVPTRMHNIQFSGQEHFRIDDSFEDMMTLTLIGMQGIINRSKPSVYIEWGFPASIEWRNEVERYVEISYLQIDPMTAIHFLMRKYGDWFNGSVVYDPEVGETINLATMIAGLEDRVMLAPVQTQIPGMPVFDSELDLKAMAGQNGWDDTPGGRLSLYQWVYDNLWDDLDHRILGVITAGPPTSGPVDDRYFELSMAGRDYLIALKLSALSLDINDPDQRNLYIKFLEEAPSPAPVTGLIGLTEHHMLQLINEYGHFMAGMHWPGEIFKSANFSLLSGIPVVTEKYDPGFNEGRIIESLRGVPVAAMFTTDGDAINYLYNHGYRGNLSWQDAQDQLIGWSINPVLANVTPVMWNEYVRTRNRAGLISSVSGAGYILPWKMNEVQLLDFLDYTNRYLKMTGLRVIHIFEDLVTYEWSETLAQTYAEHLNDAGYLGAILGYGAKELRGLGFYYTGNSAPTARTAYLLNSSTLDYVVNDLAGRKPGEEYYDINDTYPLNPDVQYLDDTDAVGEKAVYVPTSFFNSDSYSLITAIGPMSLAPGDYEVTIRAKVPDISSSTPIASIKILYDGPEQPAFLNDLPILQIHPSDFESPNQYQEFTWSFTLDTLVTELNYWIDYGDGATDIWLDVVHSTNLDGTDLPVIGTIVIDNINPLDELLNTVALEFETQFKAQGGIVLTPDEYIASLNPEFMLEMGKKYLGNSSEMMEAENLLNNKQFLGSLLVSRKAMKDIPISNEPHRWEEPSKFKLLQNYPNPFNAGTVITYQLPSRLQVELTVYDIMGRRVALLVNEQQAAGKYKVYFDASGLSSGVYFYHIKAGEYSQAQKLTLVK